LQHLQPARRCEYDHNVGRRMVVARSNCNRMGVERRSNRSQIVVATTALGWHAAPALHGWFNYKKARKDWIRHVTLEADSHIGAV